MTTNAKAAPSGGSDTAENENVFPFKVYPGSGKAKTGRTRFVRLFPERLYFLVVHLTERELVAYLRFVAQYAVGDGALKDDSKAIASVVGLSAKGWSNLRTKLIELGLVTLVDGRLVDEDQQKNLDVQRASSERQRKRINKRWGKA